MTQEYFDHEWGSVPLVQEELFEHLCLLVFQTGLTWETVLKYREGLKELFHHYDIDKISDADDEYFLQALEADVAIIRNIKKIEVCRENARCLQAHKFALDEFLIEEFPTPLKIQGGYEDLPHVTDHTRRMAGVLKELGISFIGPTAIGSLLQATGLITLETP